MVRIFRGKGTEEREGRDWRGSRRAEESRKGALTTRTESVRSAAPKEGKQDVSLSNKNATAFRFLFSKDILARGARPPVASPELEQVSAFVTCALWPVPCEPHSRRAGWR